MFDKHARVINPTYLNNSLWALVDQTYKTLLIKFIHIYYKMKPRQIY